MRIIECENYEQVCKVAADIVAAQITLKPDCIIGLPTGNTPIGMYKNLADKCSAGDLDFSEVTTFNLDEYCGITRDDPNSYYSFMKENLFSKVNLKPENAHVPNCENTDAGIASLTPVIETFSSLNARYVVFLSAEVSLKESALL